MSEFYYTFCLFLLKAKTSEFEKQKEQLEEAQSRITSLEESKGWLERRLAETEVSFTISCIGIQDGDLGDLIFRYTKLLFTPVVE